MFTASKTARHDGVYSSNSGRFTIVRIPRWNKEYVVLGGRRRRGHWKLYRRLTDAERGGRGPFIVPIGVFPRLKGETDPLSAEHAIIALEEQALRDGKLYEAA